MSNSIAQSPIIGVRLLANLFLQYSHTFTQSIYKSIKDNPWSTTCSGMADRFGKPKQIMVAFSTFLPYLAKESFAITKQWSNGDECFIVGLKSDSRIIFGIANLGSKGCSRSLSLSGLEDQEVSDAFSVTYNNGTVSMVATDPSEALVVKLPFDYDVFSAESDNESDAIEFDVTVSPNASATLVFNLSKKEESIPGDTEKNRAERSEL
uniref:Uncharacterized protein n=1 Tax=Ciona savignyi TaxID=51511 RepID=H2Y5K8_CIOSA